MMAPLQGVQNLHSLQQQVKSLPNLMPRVQNDPSLSAVSTQTIFSSTDSELQDATNNLQIDPNSVLENNNMLSSLDGENLNLNTVTSNLDLPDEKPVDGDEKPTIIQIPENLLPMFMPKKDPVRIGLKASESELEKLKCPKCDFQAYYPQQFQEHIGTHTEAIHKCKCCNFNSFDRDELLTHFKESHPRCICNICEFMAEHAYVIKRHMVRHNNQGCSCNICGKVYKDQYILKMHVKMVHMPAEVLFECNICLKKFTRKAHLKRHLRIHDPEKPFKCPHCDYRGCERSDISKHLLIHEEPKHVCEVCNKAFRHIKNKELHVKRHNGQKDYKCGVCGFYGYTFTDIRKHIERKHGDMKSLVCDRCGMAFKTEIILREHQKTSCGGVIEQALAIATSDGGTSQAMIQIPSTLSVDGQHITIDGQEISVDGDGAVNITFEQVLAADDEGIQLMEEQMGEEDITVTDGQVVAVTDAVNTQAIISQGHEIIEDEQQELELDLDDQVHAEEVDLDEQVHAEHVEQMLADG
ncbi:zinc finger protein 260 [Patella vulgata]|uniref:zinc finger protein 260 n=1 Tax=Patella vulgata TaxID=6465 RepID=UPI0024A913E8|nr:zinc finger protein 260 [Patella vulgata]